VTPGKKVSRKAPPVTVSPTASPSVRTLILGIDRTGRIVQHDRTAPKILARSSDDLLGVNLADITATQPKDGGTPVSPDKGATLVVAGLLEAIKSDREANDMLSIALADGTVASSVVTARPMSAGGSDVSAFVILQIPIPSGERFIEPGLMREVLLRDSGPSDEDTLDFSDLAKKMTAQLVPAFCTAAWVTTKACFAVEGTRRASSWRAPRPMSTGYEREPSSTGISRITGAPGRRRAQ